MADLRIFDKLSPKSRSVPSGSSSFEESSESAEADHDNEAADDDVFSR